jgi:hypothetical protein
MPAVYDIHMHGLSPSRAHSGRLTHISWHFVRCLRSHSDNCLGSGGDRRAKHVLQPLCAAVFGRRLLDQVPANGSAAGCNKARVEAPHLHPIMKRPITAKLSAQKNEIQSLREPNGGASGIELRKDGRAKIRPLNMATFANSACEIRFSTPHVSMI